MQAEIHLTIGEELQRLVGFSSQLHSDSHVDLVKNNIYTVTLNNLARQRVSAQWRVLNYLWNHYEKVIREARMGNIHGATQLLKEAETYRSQLNPTPSLGQLFDISALPAIAYLYYKQQRFAEAESLLRISIDSDEQLLADGFYILAYHRVQQLHNLARLYFKQSYLTEGIQYIREGLEFMLLRHTPSVGSGWRYQDADAVPSRLRSDMAFQLAGEIISTFQYYPQQERRLFYETFGNLLTWQAETETEHGLLQWLRSKDDFFNGRFDRFVARSVDFLVEQPARFDHYKFSLLTSLTDLLSRSGHYTPDAQGLIRSFVHQLNVPPKGRDQLLAIPIADRIHQVPVPQDV